MLLSKIIHTLQELLVYYCSHLEYTWVYSMKSFQNKFSHVGIVALVLKGMSELKSDPNENIQIYI